MPAPIEVEDENEDGLSETQLINEVSPALICCPLSELMIQEYKIWKKK